MGGQKDVSNSGARHISRLSPSPPPPSNIPRNLIWLKLLGKRSWRKGLPEIKNAMRKRWLDKSVQIGSKWRFLVNNSAFLMDTSYLEFTLHNSPIFDKYQTRPA